MSISRGPSNGDVLQSQAYVTLVTNDDFVMGAEALLLSLRDTGTARQKVVMVTPAVSTGRRQVLNDLADRIVEVEPLDMPGKERAHVSSWADVGYTKLRVWTLTEYSRVVYIDADALVLENVDDLFDRSVEFAAAPDVFPPDKFNAGVLVLVPSVAAFEDMRRQSSELPTHDGGDTGFLNSYFSDWYGRSAEARLPFGYNAQRTLYWFTHEREPGYWEAIRPLKIIHFCSSPKPWQETDKKGDLEFLWWDKYISSKMGCLELHMTP
ncbi:unnamed protein product [Discosporangium mesarthrocarpum]